MPNERTTTACTGLPERVFRLPNDTVQARAFPTSYIATGFYHIITRGKAGCRETKSCCKEKERGHASEGPCQVNYQFPYVPTHYCRKKHYPHPIRSDVFLWGLQIQPSAPVTAQRRLRSDSASPLGIIPRPIRFSRFQNKWPYIN